jgi:hypothetical protein
MARLQILELPEGTGDDRPPFVLVVDQVATGPDGELLLKSSDFEGVNERIGARAVLVFEETVEIPANDVPVDADGNPLFLKMHIEGDFEQFREQVQDEILHAQGKVTRAMDGTRAAQERTDIARDMDRLAKHRDELADALGMDRTRDWDDIRNAAAGLRKQRDSQAAELGRLRAGEEPITDERVAPNPGQWIWHWNRATPEKRLSMAAQIQDGMTRSNNCFMADHEAQIERLQAEVSEARSWARHGYEIGQKHCGWTDHGVAPDWLTEGWPPHIESCEYLKQAAEYDEAISRVRELHQPVEYRGQTICRECSACAGSSTDNAPVAHDQCGTLRALGNDTEPSPGE